MSERKRFREVSPELRRAARQMRHAPTSAEDVLWEALRAGRMNGLKFRRQHAVGRFILDFYCPAHHLVVEVDGGIHDEQQERDAARTVELGARGYRVLRVRNEEVLYSLPAVLDRIRHAAQETIPPLPPAGEGVRG